MREFRQILRREVALGDGCRKRYIVDRGGGPCIRWQNRRFEAPSPLKRPFASFRSLPRGGGVTRWHHDPVERYRCNTLRYCTLRPVARSHRRVGSPESVTTPFFRFAKFSLVGSRPSLSLATTREPLLRKQWRSYRAERQACRRSELAREKRDPAPIRGCGAPYDSPFPRKRESSRQFARKRAHLGGASRAMPVTHAPRARTVKMAALKGLSGNVTRNFYGRTQ